ncbi:MAG: hypothetical protein GY795_17785 [Desulfobacterales bacterium]|nr:hypothetical protein [Desulfobacterales bacterium]
MTSNVQLIITGSMERIALSKALGKAFPEINFLPSEFENGFTSFDILNTPYNVKPRSAELPIDKLAKRLVTAVFPGKRRDKPVDMAIAIDDLELENIHQPDAVVNHFRDAVERYINSQIDLVKQNNSRQIIRERCSFHLFVPMTEAYFFGDPDAIVRAKRLRPSSVSGRITDVEQFQVTNDQVYLTTPEGEIYWANKMDKRAQHPKCYIKYLCDPKGVLGEKNGYRETHNGVSALKDIDWNSVCCNKTHVKFLRSLFDDISKRFNLWNPYAGNCAQATYNDGKGLVLRNI